MASTNPERSEQTRQELERLAETIAARLDDGAAQSAMTAQMAAAGFDPDEAAEFVEHVDKVRRSRHRRGGLLTLLFGAALSAAGVGVTAYTYATAQPGGSYVVWWGVILWGVVMMLYGINRMTKEPARGGGRCMACGQPTEGAAALCPGCLSARSAG